MFKIDQRVEQINVNNYISKIGWVGTVKKVLNKDTVLVKFDNYTTELEVDVKNLKSSVKVDAKLEALIAEANIGLVAVRTLVREYQGQVHYNSPKFKGGADHLCEKATRLLEFDLATKATTAAANFEAITIDGIGFDIDGDELDVDGSFFEINEFVDAIQSALENEEQDLFTVKRTGIIMENGDLLTWAGAEQILKLLKAYAQAA